MEHGAYDGFDAATHKRLQSVADGTALREAYSKWYKQGQGRATERQLVDIFETQTAGTPLARHRLDDEEDPSLMDACQAALAATGVFQPEEYMQLQRVINSCNGDVHDAQLSKQEVLEAADRRLHSTKLAEQLTAGWR